MRDQLKPGQQFSLVTTGSAGTVSRMIDRGGQGSVYEVQVGGQKQALKWYHPEYLPCDPHLRPRLERIIQMPGPGMEFVWPLDMATIQGEPSFGYVMPLLEDRFHSIDDLVWQRVDPTFRTLITVGRQLANSYYQLHSKGRSYRDISKGNCRFDPNTGDVAILDNDNIDTDGTASGIGGTPGFIAPELVRRRALVVMDRMKIPVDSKWRQENAQPGTQTDLYSLAVLLFHILVRDHPLRGIRDPNIEDEGWDILGFHPLFIFDPSDRSNAPDPVRQKSAIKAWSVYPEFLRRLFVQAFTDGLHDPRKRVRETVWVQAFERLRDLLIYCPSCERENIVDLYDSNDPRPQPCWSCGQPVHLPCHLRLENGDVVMLNADTRLYPYHLERKASRKSHDALAEVSRHPTLPNVWGLRNLTQERWTYRQPGEEMASADPGRSIRIAPGVTINFGRLCGEIHS